MVPPLNIGMLGEGLRRKEAEREEKIDRDRRGEGRRMGCIRTRFSFPGKNFLVVRQESPSTLQKVTPTKGMQSATREGF